MLANNFRNSPFLDYLRKFTSKNCSICNESDEKSLAYCNDCRFYFCNNTYKGESHIVSHLKKCNHTQIDTHLLPAYKLKCKECGNKNIFELRFLKETENFFSILCKKCSENKLLYKDIIQNNKVNTDILKDPMVPPVANMEFCITKINRDIKLLLKIEKVKIPPSSLCYSGASVYSLQLQALILEEINTIRIENAKSSLLPFNLEFEYPEEKHEHHCFITVKNPNYKLFEKNKIDIFKNDKVIIEGAKVRFKKNDSVILYCKKIEKRFSNGEYHIQLTESIQNYERMIYAAEKIGKNKSMNENLMKMILGNITNLDINIREDKVRQIKSIQKFYDEFIKMNPSQIKAIQNALKYHLSLVIGPPGTGKTLLLVNLVFNLLSIKGSTEKILITAPTNKAIDNIIIVLKKYKKYVSEKFVRVLSPSKELSEDIDTTVSIHKLAEKEINSNPKKYADLIKLIEKKQKNGYLKESEYKRYKTKLKDIEDNIIEDANIVLSTINNSADKRLKDYNFSYVLVDEAAQSLEPDTILPLVHCAQMLVLIGDDKQLGPVIHSEEANIAGLGVSLFERLHILYGNAPFITLLNEQYRMNEKLCRFSNRKWYGDQIITKVKVIPDENPLKIFPRQDYPLLFYNVIGAEETENNSYFNQTQILSVFKSVNKCMENNIKLVDIGVITNYSAQKQRLYEKFYTKEKYQELTIDTVDGFQGMEKDYIIISTVRDNFQGILGFIKSAKRLNVALTRARKGLIIIGNAKCLSKRPGLFREFVSYCCENGLIVNEPF